MMPYAITNRIVKALHSKDTSEKARLLESVVAMNYKEWRVFHELGKAYAELGNQEKARKYFLQAVENAKKTALLILAT